MQTKQITEFSFWEFCVSVQNAVKEGYEFSSDNDKMPTAYVGNYNCVMVKNITEDLEIIKDALIDGANSVPKETLLEALKGLEVQTEVKTSQTKGRKPKTN